MLRFAPDLTTPMQISHLRVALFNALLARRRDESLIIRIDDTDDKNDARSKEMLQLLALFGIEYRDVIYQSNHLRYHRAMAIQLLHDKKAFNCFCSPDMLARKRAAAEAAGEPYRYDDTCTHLPPDATIDNENPFTVRLHRPDAPITVNDLIRGEIRFDPRDVDSAVLLRADKRPTAEFASAVDDMLSDVSLVVCDEAELDSTPRQIAVRTALGYDKPIAYAHLSAIDASEATSVKSLLEAGFLPEAIGNYLILLGNETPTEIFTMAEAAEWFAPESLPKTPATFELEKLRAINREHLKRMEATELSRYVGFADAQIGQLAKHYLEEVSTTRELKAKIDAIFAEKSIPEADADTTETIRRTIKTAPHFETFEPFKAHLIQVTGIDGAPLDATLRRLLTGAEEGPELPGIYDHIKNYLGEIIK